MTKLHIRQRKGKYQLWFCILDETFYTFECLSRYRQNDGSFIFVQYVYEWQMPSK